MKRNDLMALVVGLVMGVSTPLALADGDHGHGHGHDDAKHHDMKGHGGHDMGAMQGMFLKKKTIDGYTVSFHVMEAKQGMRHGGSHNFMIKVEKNGKALDDIKVNSKVVHPNGKAQTKMLMKMGDWYMAGYDLGHAGKHKLMILFKTADGSKHSGGVYYP